MRNNILLTILIFFVSLGSSVAQNNFKKGFIITLENDTIQGLVEYRSNSKNYESCIFKTDKGERTYFPNQINGFGYIDDKLFSSRVIENAFVEVLVIGNLSLYKHKFKYLIRKDTSTYELESHTEEVEVDGKIGIVETTKWKGILTYLISDCLQNPGGLTSNINLEEKSLTRLILKYNKCTGSEVTELKAGKPWTKFSYGLIGGVTRSEIKITDELNTYTHMDDAYSSIDPFIGILIEIASPRITERFTFQGELQFLKSSYSSLVTRETTFIQHHDTFIDLTTLSIPLSLKYALPQKKYGAHFQVGVNFDYHLNGETRLSTEQVIGDNVNTLPEDTAFEIRNELNRSFRAGVRTGHIQN